MLSRRALIGKAAVGAAGALALGAARTGVASTRALRATTGNPGDDRDGPAADRGGQKAPPAHVVAANEAKVPAGVLAELLPHAERVRRFAATDGTPAMEGKLR